MNSLTSNPLNIKTPKTVLVIQLRQLGDILLTTPCVKALKDKWPSAKIVFLSHKMGKLVISGNPYVDEHIVYDGKESILGQLKLIKKLRAYKFDLAVDFMCSPRSAVLSFFSGAANTVSYKSRRSFLYDHVFDHKKGVYIVDEKFDLLNKIGVESGDRRLILSYEPKDAEKYKAFKDTELEGDSSNIKVVLSPTHRRENRMWALENYSKLADWLCETWGAEVIWLWGPGEREVVENCRSMCKHKTLLAPDTTFRELAAFISQCNLFVGNSNGPSHVAVSTGVPSLQLHGHTSGISWCPDTTRHSFVQSSEYPSNEATLNPIKVDDVTMKLTEMKSVIMKYKENLDKLGLKTDWKPELGV